MGRKAAPQPLALPSQSSYQSQTDTALRSQDDPQDIETSPCVSPAGSRSPRSTRSSPFHSRFSPLRNQGGNHRKVSQATDALSSIITTSTPASSTPSVAESESKRDRYPQGAHPQSSPEDPPSACYPSISSALDHRPQAPGQPTSTAATTQSESTRSSPSDPRKVTKNGFFHFNKPSNSLNQPPHVLHQQNPSEERNQIMSRGSDGSSRPRHGDPSRSEHTLQEPSSADPLRSDLSLSSAGDYDTASPQSSTKKGRAKPFGLLSRSRSDRDREGASPEPRPVPSPSRNREPELHLNSVPIRNAPASADRSFRDMMSTGSRNRSEDRAPRDSSSTRKGHREKESKTQPSSLHDNSGSNFLNGLKSSGTRAADMFSNRFFGKGGRSSKEAERDAVDDEHYQLKVINLPLVEQTRRTRISKRLEDSRDKTEFWMPAFPWRAIDYLNYKGCEVEGLYRVPGSGPQIKKWQRKFDEQYDVNLFEENDLYDINIIGSMLKAWLRELPDELFPKAAQERVARECVGAEQVPESLIEELSNLSPFNYYLLFAVTCHLSLLLAHSDKNKMDFRNLCICFQPCMKIDAHCFKFLVCEWRDCWRGCKNEAKFIEEEYMLFDQPPPRGLAEPQKPRPQEPDETSKPQEPDEKPKTRASDDKARTQVPDGERRQLSSSDSSKQSGRLSPGDQKKLLKRKQLPLSASNGSVTSNDSTVSTILTINGDREAVGRASGDMRPLSPIKPLSPLGF